MPPTIEHNVKSRIMRLGVAAYILGGLADAPPLCLWRRAARTYMLLAILAAAAFYGFQSPAIAAFLDEPIVPLPMTLAVNRARADIGRKLFFDRRLSANGSVSCATCHDLAKGGMDGRRHSVGLHGRETSANTPSVFDAAFNFRQFWNGRADTLEQQIDDVIQSPIEMGSKWKDVVQVAAKFYQT